MQNKLPKLIVILGPTACGKTEWGIRIAKKYNGEVISADSRQIYQKMSIGTAKPKGVWKLSGAKRAYMVDGVPHHLIAFLDPGKLFTLVQFRDLAVKRIQDILKRGRVPMIVGGTGLYISSVVDNLDIPRVEPNQKLRKSLEGKSAGSLLSLLKKLDPDAAKKIDAKNKRRLIRALEVCIMSGEPFSEQQKKGEPLFDVLEIGIDMLPEALRENIHTRVQRMIKLGLVDEIRELLRQRYSWKLSSMSGVGYRQFRRFFEGHCSIEEAVERLERDTRQFARRQMTWFRRDKRIRWCKNIDEAEKMIEEFLK